MPETRNVLFIIIDQLRADCVTGALADHVALPNLRALMEESVTFTNHYSVTNPCGPSRASILTGQYAMNHRSVRNGTPLRHDTPNLATEMHKAGYNPMLFGYTDTSHDPRVHASNDPALKSYEFPMTGFDEKLEMRFETSHPWRDHLTNRGYTFENYSDLFKPVSPTNTTAQINDPAVYTEEDSDTAFLTNGFIDKMQFRSGQSWFAHLTYIRPHPPLVAPAPYNRMYDPAALPLPSRLDSREAEFKLHPFIEPALAHATPDGMVVGFPKLEQTDDNIQRLRSVYFGLATEVDHHIGRVIRFLKDNDQFENTMIVVTADHGEMLGDRYAWGKMSIYDAAYHTPLIIRTPGCESSAGMRVNRPTEAIDVAPTILDWIGQDVPNSMDGRSLLPFIFGEAPEDWRTHTYSELDFSNPQTPTLWQDALGTSASNSCLGILREERFTLIEFASDLPPILFDAKGDGERKNVATDPKFATDLYRLTRRMLQHRMQHMDHTLSLDSITLEGPRKKRRRPPTPRPALP
ncbi:MAG: sulfatase-like hydrolase/transferase [Paracoccaceae bacterium]